MKNPSERLKKLENEIKRSQNKIEKLKKGIPLFIFIGIVFSLAYPYIPGRRGRGPLAETMGYEYSVIFSAIVFIVVVPVGYYMVKKDLGKKIRRKSKEIKSLKYRMENEPNTL